MLDINANASFNGSTGIAPRACQKSPKNNTPARVATASSCTFCNTSLHVSIVRLLTCKSLNTIQRSTASCAGDADANLSTTSTPLSALASASAAAARVTPAA